jgi:hypothetical protein
MMYGVTKGAFENKGSNKFTNLELIFFNHFQHFLHSTVCGRTIGNLYISTYIHT